MCTHTIYWDTRKNIGECLILVFNTEPMERPIRPHRVFEYEKFLNDLRETS